MMNDFKGKRLAALFIDGKMLVDNEVKVGESVPPRREATPLEKYNILTALLRELSAEEPEPEEEYDELLDYMDGVWWELTEAERDSLKVKSG